MPQLGFISVCSQLLKHIQGKGQLNLKYIYPQLIFNNMKAATLVLYLFDLVVLGIGGGTVVVGVLVCKPSLVIKGQPR